MSSASAIPTRVTITPTTDPAPIRAIALETWYPTYEKILGSDQIEYMLEQVYSIDSLSQQMNDGQSFLLLSFQGQPAAFAAFSCLDQETNLFKLNKLYTHPAHQGKGYGKLLLEEVTQLVNKLGGQKMELNVHRENPALQFYFKHGFTIKEKVDIPFGPFTLNDYILTLNITAPIADGK